MPNNRSTERLALHPDEVALHPDALALDPDTVAVHLSGLARRFEDLERQNRRLKQLLVAAVVVLAAVGARAQVAPTAVTGDRFVLVDAQNRTRATLDTALPAAGQARYAVLTFLDAAGRPRLRLGLAARGALLEVVDENGKARDYLGPVSARPLTQP
jgi:hypothetical protein